MTEIYTTGTIAVTNGSVDFVGTGTSWLPSSMKRADQINVAGFMCGVAELTDPTRGKFAIPYPGPTAAGLPYAVFRTSSEYGTNRSLSDDVAEMIRLLTTGQLFEWIIALSHEDGVIGEQVGVITVPIPKDIRVQELSMWLNSPSDSGDVATDIMIDGVSVLVTKLFVKQGQHSSNAPGTTPYVITNPNWSKGQVLRIDFLTPGSNSAGAKLTISGQRRT